jgi:hypothetical protein
MALHNAVTITVMRTIYKYPFTITESIVLPLPVNAAVVHVGLDGAGVPCIWALVDTAAPTTAHHFRLLGTGHTIPDDLCYVGTFTMAGATLVWHLFSCGLVAVTGA